MSASDFEIRRFGTREATVPYKDGMKRLLGRYSHILALEVEDSTPEVLLSHTLETIPYLWGVVRYDEVFALGCLDNIIFGRQAFIHGVSGPTMRRHPAMMALARCVLKAAFDTLQVQKIKAEFEADNLSAKGFCWRMGFRRETYMKRHIRLQGRWHDVALYGLDAEQYQRLEARWCEKTGVAG